MIAETELPLINLVGLKCAGKSTVLDAIVRLFLPPSLRTLSKAELVRRFHHPPHIKVVRSATERDRREGEKGSWESPGSWEREFFNHEDFERLLNNSKYGPDVVLDDREKDPLFALSNQQYADFLRHGHLPPLGDYPSDIIRNTIRWVSDNGVLVRAGVTHPRNWPDPDEDTLFYLANFADSTEDVIPWIRNYFCNMKSFFLSVEPEEVNRRLVSRSKDLGISYDAQRAINERYGASHPEKGCIVVYNGRGRTPEKCAREILHLAGVTIPNI